MTMVGSITHTFESPLLWGLPYHTYKKQHGACQSFDSGMSQHLHSAHSFIVDCFHLYTQAEVASRDANIRQLIERCELLKEKYEQIEAQVSLTVCIG